MKLGGLEIGYSITDIRKISWEKLRDSDFFRIFANAKYIQYNHTRN